MLVHYAAVTSNPQPIPARLNLDAWLMYEASKLGLWRAICKKNPQLALFSEVYGDSPDSGAEWVSYSTSDPIGEPVHLTEPRQERGNRSGNGLQGSRAHPSGAYPAAVSRSAAQGWGRTMLGRMGLTPHGQVVPVPTPPLEAGTSAPITCDVDGPAHRGGAKEVQ